jgi:outer membrane protein TolC
VRRSIESSKIQSDIGELNIAELKLSLERDLNSAYDTYNNRIKIVGISHANVGIAKINLDLGSDKFRNGTINSFNYRDIQLKYILASLNELEAAYLLIQSHTELVRLTGGILSNTEQ